MAFGVGTGLSWPVSNGDPYDPGAAATASARFKIAGLPLCLGPELGYVYKPLKNTSIAVSLGESPDHARKDFLSPTT